MAGTSPNSTMVPPKKPKKTKLKPRGFEYPEKIENLTFTDRATTSRLMHLNENFPVLIEDSSTVVRAEREYTSLEIGKVLVDSYNPGGRFSQLNIASTPVNKPNKINTLERRQNLTIQKNSNYFARGSRVQNSKLSACISDLF